MMRKNTRLGRWRRICVLREIIHGVGKPGLEMAFGHGIQINT